MGAGNPDAYRAYMRDYMRTRRNTRRETLRKMLGGTCEFCGSTEQLEFDHIDPVTKLFEISKPSALDGPWERLVDEAKKCRLLCNPCHVEHSGKQKSKIVHGTHWCYRKYKCRCAPCVLANTETNKKYKQTYMNKRSPVAQLAEQRPVKS